MLCLKENVLIYRNFLEILELSLIRKNEDTTCNITINSAPITKKCKFIVWDKFKTILKDINSNKSIFFSYEKYKWIERRVYPDINLNYLKKRMLRYVDHTEDNIQYYPIEVVNTLQLSLNSFSNFHYEFKRLQFP